MAFIRVNTANWTDTVRVILTIFPLQPLEVKIVVSSVQLTSPSVSGCCRPTLHDRVFNSDGLSPLVTKECGGSGVVAPAPHQVEDGVLHTAPTGGVADH